MLDELNSYFDSFLETALGFSIPKTDYFSVNWSQLSADKVEETSRHFAHKVLNEIHVWSSNKSKRIELEKWDAQQKACEKIAQEARQLNRDLVDKHFKIVRPTYEANDYNSDIWNIKINHGFWEQMFMIHADGYDAELMRPTARLGFHECYYFSRFEQALQESVRRVCQISDTTMSFPGMDFGFAFHAGGHWHDTWVSKNWGNDPASLRVAKGTYAGARLFFDEFSKGRPIELSDGSFAKKSLLEGSLVTHLKDAADNSDRVIFCVPPHLQNVRLKCADLTKQSTLFVSGRFVHHAWPPTLAGHLKEILEGLARGQNITVIVQAAVFSALLGAVLKDIKNKLDLPGKIFFFDLGQALDVGASTASGNWVNKLTKEPGWMGNNGKNNPFFEI